MVRNSGILMHISSLPSDFGIGTLGKEAREFVDFLHRAGQRYWQILPIGPVSYGDSPYQSFSAFAGNPYFIDLTQLCEEGLLKKGEISRIDWGKDRSRVDYTKLYQNRFQILYRAFQRGYDKTYREYEAFANENSYWLEDYGLFMALKEYFGMVSWTLWPEKPIRRREPQAVHHYRQLLHDRVEFWKYLQFLFSRQWQELLEYAHRNGVEIIGDMPLYVAMDSADAWSHPQMLELNDQYFPAALAGCPPDAFSEDGQLWGNPLYRWDVLAQNRYEWWIQRVAMLVKRCDVIRIDHFRGLESYYRVPSEETTARNGSWVKGPGIALFEAIREKLGPIRFIAEDLGFLTPAVYELLHQTGFPGMKVLQFGFHAWEESTHLPHTYSKNCVVYTGTHDNDTIRGWIKSCSSEDVRLCYDYLGIRVVRDLCWAMISCAWESVAETAIAPMQDFLELSSAARMNTPATLGGNWQWRLKKGALTERLANRIYRITKIYGRLA